MEKILHEGDCQCIPIYSNVLCTWNHFHCGLNKTTEITLSAIAVLRILTLHQTLSARTEISLSVMIQLASL